MPRLVRAQILMRHDLGWMPRERDRNRAMEVVSSVRLLTAARMHRLFPEATLYRERWFGMTKSIVAYDGWKHPLHRA
jgi:hypothetical protein